MGDSSDFVFEVDSDFEIELVASLSDLALGDDTTKLTGWLVHYREHEIDVNHEIDDQIQRLKKVVEAFGGFHRSYKESVAYRAATVSESYLREMDSALSKIISVSGTAAKEADVFRSLLREQQLVELERRLRRLAAADPKAVAREALDAYRRRLEEPASLVGELIRVLITEYNRRIAVTRKRLEHYVKLLRESDERIDARVAMIDRSVGELDHDAMLGAEDRGRLKEAFGLKRAELGTIRQSQRDKEKRVASLLAAMRTSASTFAELTEMLRAKLLQHRARESYIGRLQSIDSKVPELTPLLTEITDSLRSNVEVVQRTFLLFNETFQSTLLGAIDVQTKMNRIMLSTKGRIDIELAVPAGSGEESVARPEANGGGLLDLSFLASIGKRTGPQNDGSAQ